jgi:hypothetical protein
MMNRFSLFLALTVSVPLWAEPQHMLDYVLPRGGTVGTTVDVTLKGRYLDDPREIVFYDNGVKAINVKAGAKPGEEVKAQFQIAPNARAGEHVLRLRTATGLTEAMTFWVDRFPTVMETEKKIGDNDTPEKAQSVAMNTTVEGQILPGDRPDIDTYWMRVDEGQRISVEVDAVRLGTLHFSQGDADLSVRILDDQGKVVAKADDSAMYVQDPVVSIVSPHTGNYYIEISQQMYERPNQVWYRAHIGNFTRPTAIYPAGGQAGEKLAVKVLGDPTGERTEQLTLPNVAGPVDYYSGVKGQQPPSPNVLRVSTYPNVLKVEGDEPTPVPALPAALNGIFIKQNGVDEFRFTAKKNEAWHVQVFARTLGSPMDPKFTIRAAKAPNPIVSADDSKLADLGQPSNRGTWHMKEMLDPVAIFKAPADGEYILAISDTRGQAGPQEVYRVEIEPVRDTVYTHITSPDAYQIPRVTGMIIPQGSRWTLTLQMAQGLGNIYKGDLEIQAVGLPKGVTMIAPRYTKGATRMPVQFIAARDAEQQTAFIQLLARPVDKSVKLDSASRQAIALYNHPGEYPWHYVFLDKFALAVTKPAPFDISMDAPAIPIARSGEMVLKVKVDRHGDFKGPVELQADWLPPGVSSGGAITVPADKSEGEIKIQANGKAEPGIFQVAINASTTQTGDAFSGFGRVRVSTPFVKLEVSEPYLSIDLRRSAVERGKRGEIVGAIKENKPLPGAATVKLLRLPKGVTLVGQAPEIKHGDKEVVFEVQASNDALLGMYKEIACEVTVVDRGQSIQQQTGSGILRVDPARTATTATATR